MKVELVKLDEFPGDKAHLYSVSIDDSDDTLFDIFLEENLDNHHTELNNILAMLKTMNEETGAREQYFKLWEGLPGDGVAAIYDLPGKNLRLYCIRYGSVTVILGGGGYKAKTVRTYQEDPLLNNRAQTMRKISQLLTEYIKSKDIVLNEDGTISCDIILDDNENN